MRIPVYPPLSEATAQRCADIDEDAGQCQLLASHVSYCPHSARVLDAHVTWKDTGWVIRWPVRAPRWLHALPWAPGYHPAEPEPAQESEAS